MQKVLENVFFSKDLVSLELEAKDSEEALRKVASVLESNKLVKSSFSDAVVAREKVFPTGLSLGTIGVAIPHTDVEHVEKQSMAIGILKEPVQFVIMGTDDVSVEVSIMFMLAIKESHAQLEFLQALMELFQKDDCVSDIVNSNSAEEVLSKFKKYIS